MRVLHVVQPPRGGAVTSALLLAREQTERHTVGVVCHSAGPAAEIARVMGAEVWPISISRKIQPLRDLGHVHKLRQIVQEFRPDVLHAHSSKGGVLGRIAGKVSNVPVVFSPHNFAYRAYEGGCVARFAFYLIERAMAPLTECLHVVSRDEYEDAIRNGIASSSRCGMIPNGIDLKPLLALEPRHGEPPMIGTYARMFSQKRIDFLLDAFAILRARGIKFRALVIGDGPERERLIAYARAHRLERHVVFDSAPHDAAAALSRIDVFALSSSHEACPLSVMEAMAAGRPVVATAVGGVSEMVTEGESGLVIPFGETMRFAEALERAVTDKGLRCALGAAGRRKAAARFGAEVMADRMEALYQQAVEHSR